ncbi:hypothetical protein CTI12_AA023770 [Artemisia annua]|uniref:Uncharacterized protein n=1 Tax=Artemisia annua TaxID=35608 RepID=A0A2U1QJ50_ARTAN|nr:hypothetical protein CTI12_AA023770 [Artemisia annua]
MIGVTRERDKGGGSAVNTGTPNPNVSVQNQDTNGGSDITPLILDSGPLDLDNPPGLNFHWSWCRSIRSINENIVKESLTKCCSMELNLTRLLVTKLFPAPATYGQSSWKLVTWDI